LTNVNIKIIGFLLAAVNCMKWLFTYILLHSIELRNQGHAQPF